MRTLPMAVSFYANNFVNNKRSKHNKIVKKRVLCDIVFGLKVSSKMYFIRRDISKTGILVKLTENLVVILSSLLNRSSIKKIICKVCIDTNPPSLLFAYVCILMEPLLVLIPNVVVECPLPSREFILLVIISISRE